MMARVACGCGVAGYPPLALSACHYSMETTASPCPPPNAAALSGIAAVVSLAAHFVLSAVCLLLCKVTANMTSTAATTRASAALVVKATASLPNATWPSSPACSAITTSSEHSIPPSAVSPQHLYVKCSASKLCGSSRFTRSRNCPSGHVTDESFVGAELGANVGVMVGAIVGASVVGSIVGVLVGSTVGTAVG